jgi:hypothetical protein
MPAAKVAAGIETAIARTTDDLCRCYQNTLCCKPRHMCAHRHAVVIQITCFNKHHDTPLPQFSQPHPPCAATPCAQQVLQPYQTLSTRGTMPTLYGHDMTSPAAIFSSSQQVTDCCQEFLQRMSCRGPTRLPWYHRLERSSNAAARCCSAIPQHASFRPPFECLIAPPPTIRTAGSSALPGLSNLWHCLGQTSLPRP